MSIEVGQLYYYTYESPLGRGDDVKGYFIIAEVLPNLYDEGRRAGYALLWLNEKCKRVMGEVVGPRFINNDPYYNDNVTRRDKCILINH